MPGAAAHDGAGIAIYTVDFKGYVPWAVVLNSPSDANWVDGNGLNGNQEHFWYWHFTLSQVLNRNILGPDGLVNRESPIFHDKDTIESIDGRYVNHYTVNPRILYDAHAIDNAPQVFGAAQALSSRKIDT